MSDEKTPTMERLITIKEASAFLGIKQKTLRQWVWKRKITYYKMDHSVRFKLSEIIEMIERGRVPAKSTEI